MALPDPHPGLVVCYAYLWESEALRGRDEGVKDRPCAIVTAQRRVRGRTIVTVVPVTHSPPASPEEAIELPRALKAHLGLDDAPSWIVLSEVNEFVWPGPDLRAASRARPDEFAFGVLPPKFFARMRDRLIELARERRVRKVARTE